MNPGSLDRESGALDTAPPPTTTAASTTHTVPLTSSRVPRRSRSSQRRRRQKTFCRGTTGDRRRVSPRSYLSSWRALAPSSLLCRAGRHSRPSRRTPLCRRPSAIHPRRPGRPRTGGEADTSPTRRGRQSRTSGRPIERCQVAGPGRDGARRICRRR